MKYAIRVVAVLWLFIATMAHAVEFSDGPRAREVLEDQVKTLFESGKFAELDKMADQFRKNKSRFPDGVWKLQVFYAGFDMPLGVPAPYFPGHIDLAKKWLQSNPRSVTAQCVLASLWKDYAWKARGGEYASEVKKEAWPVVRERLDKAWQIINEPLAPSTTDCPRRHSLRLVLAKLMGVERKQYEAIFKEAIRQSPDYYHHYVEKADYLLPKWHGSTGEWQRYIMKVADQNSQREGSTIYTRTVFSMYLSGEVDDFKKSGVSWPKMREGLKEIDRNYPNSQWILNNTAKFACRARDLETLRTTIKRIDKNNYYSEAWEDTKIDDCRRLVGMSSLYERKK